MVVLREIRGAHFFPSMPNFRRLNENIGDTTQEKNRLKLFRSSRPDFLTEDDVEKFKKLGIRSIIDCRSPSEYRKADGDKRLDHVYPVYKLKLPFLNKYKHEQDIILQSIAKNEGNTKSSTIIHPLSMENNINGTEDAKQKSEAKHQNNTHAHDCDSDTPPSPSTNSPDLLNHDNIDQSNADEHNGSLENSMSSPKTHVLIDFFLMNYVWSIFKKAPWFIQLFSLLYLVVDLILNTHFKYFVRFFARNVLNKKGLIGQYIDMINHSQGSIYGALTILSQPENVPAMINCAHGKDRTGIISALVLACLGATTEEIVADYSRSEEELADIHPRIHQEIVEKFHMCTTFTGSKAETMRAVLVYIQEQYGSVSNYLESIGFSAACQEKLRQNLLQ